MPITDIPTDADAVHSMRQCGNEFMKRLADCWLVANPWDQARLKLAFQSEFERYRQLARLRAMDEQARAEAGQAFDAHVRTISVLKPLEQHVADGEGRN
jgi:hypothetical protein